MSDILYLVSDNSHLGSIPSCLYVTEEGHSKGGFNLVIEESNQNNSEKDVQSQFVNEEGTCSEILTRPGIETGVAERTFHESVFVELVRDFPLTVPEK